MFGRGNLTEFFFFDSNYTLTTDWSAQIQPYNPLFPSCSANLVTAGQQLYDNCGLSVARLANTTTAAIDAIVESVCFNTTCAATVPSLLSTTLNGTCVNNASAFITINGTNNWISIPEATSFNLDKQGNASDVCTSTNVNGTSYCLSQFVEDFSTMYQAEVAYVLVNGTCDSTCEALLENIICNE